MVEVLIPDPRIINFGNDFHLIPQAIEVIQNHGPFGMHALQIKNRHYSC